MQKSTYLLLALCLACQPRTQQVVTTPELGLDQLKQKLDSLYQAEINPAEPGAALLVAYNGEMVLSNGYGLRDVASQLPITPSTNMRLASVSKQFTALCILTLADQGLLNLSDQASDYLPHPIFEGITIEQLANHTSGLPDYYEHFIENWDREKILENQDVLNWLATGPERAFEPGAQWEYSNTAYLMLALIVEKVSGQEFSAFAREHVFQKAGMERTTYYNLAKPADIPERAYCYEIDDQGQIDKVDGFFMNGVMGDGAVYTSINDYFQYDQALRKQSILSTAMHERMFQSSSSHEVEGVERHYAMGWGVTDSTASHSGGWLGTNTYTKRYFDIPLTYTIFMNRNTLFSSGLMQKTDSLVTMFYKRTK